MAAKKHTKSLLTKVQFVLAAVAVAGGAWLAWTAFDYSQAKGVYDGIREAYANESDASATTAESINFDALTKDYPNAIGWIHFDAEDTKVDYPIVQGTDNEHYLHYDATDTYSRYGSIFLDYRNNSFTTDLHTIVYGHNMLDDGMFGGLHKFDDEEYFKNNPTTFWIATPNGVYHYQIFAVNVVYPDDEIFTVGYKNTEVFDAFVQKIKAESIYDTGVSVSGKDQVVTLATCNNPNTQRFVISAKLVGED